MSAAPTGSWDQTAASTGEGRPVETAPYRTDLGPDLDCGPPGLDLYRLLTEPALLLHRCSSSVVVCHLQLQLPVVLVFFRRQSREDSGSLRLPCFCYGHSQQCSAQSGYSVHNITSTFTSGNFSAPPTTIKCSGSFRLWGFFQNKSFCWVSGPEGWRVATAGGVTPYGVYFRWSPKHLDLEVISKHNLPTYLYAPGETSSSPSTSLEFFHPASLTRCFLRTVPGEPDAELWSKLLLLVTSGPRHPTRVAPRRDPGGWRSDSLRLPGRPEEQRPLWTED